MYTKEKEAMDILQEECGEVIVAVSKISRFGLDNVKPGKPLTNRQHLAEELGDLQAMINLCIDHNLVDKEEVIVRLVKHSLLEINGKPANTWTLYRIFGSAHGYGMWFDNNFGTKKLFVANDTFSGISIV